MQTRKSSRPDSVASPTPRDRLVKLGLARSEAVLEKTAGGQELGVEQSGAGGTADEVVGKQREFYVQQGAFADAADDRGHAVAGADVAARLRASFVVEDDDGIPDRGRKRGQFVIHFESTQGFADFVEGVDFLEADGDAFEVTLQDR